MSELRTVNRVKCTIGEAKALAIPFVEQRQPVLLVGPPGIGKTAVTEQIAAELGWRHEVVTVSQLDITDPKGLPWLASDGSASRWVPVGLFGDLCDTTDNVVLTLDDFGQGTHPVQAALSPIIHSTQRQVGEQRLSDGVAIVATTNSDEDEAGANPLLTMTLGRFALVLHVEPSASEVADYFEACGYDPLLCAFLRFRADLVCDPSPAEGFDPTYSPRGWEAVGRSLNFLPDPAQFDHATVNAGQVGRDAATEWGAFRALAHVLPDLDTIEADPLTAPIPDRPDVRFATAAFLAAETDHVNFPVYLSYVERWPQQEFHVLYVRSALNRDETLVNVAEFGEFASRHQDLF